MQESLSDWEWNHLKTQNHPRWPANKIVYTERTNVINRLSSPSRHPGPGQSSPWMQNSSMVMEVIGKKGSIGDQLPKISIEDVKELPRRAENSATTLKGRGYLSHMVIIIRHNQV